MSESHPVETEQAPREASGAHPYGRYLEEFERVLVPGGYGVIHHPGTTYASPEDRKSGWRSHMTDRLFARLAAKAHLQVVEQSGALVHRQGDVITVIAKPGGRNPSPGTPRLDVL